MKLKFKVEKRRMKEKSVRLVVFGIVLVLLASGIGTVSAFSNSGDGDWKYYKEITVKENSGKSLTDYQVLVELKPANFPAKAKSDGSDLRFEDASGKELNYWIEEWNYPNNAKIWVKVPSIPANGETKIKMYYGNPSASAVSDGDKVFEFFDNFSVDTSSNYAVDNLFQQGGSISYDSTNKRLKLTTSWYEGGTAGHNVFYYKVRKFNKDISVVSKVYFLDGGIDMNGNGRSFKVISRYVSGGNNPPGRCAGLWEESRWSPTEQAMIAKDSRGDRPITHAPYSYSEGETYTFRLGSFEQKSDFYINGKLVLSATSLTGISDGYVGWETYAANIAVDDFRVAKYTPPEPTLTFSAEYTTAKPIPTATPTPVPTPIQEHIKLIVTPSGEGIYNITYTEYAPFTINVLRYSNGKGIASIPIYQLEPKEFEKATKEYLQQKATDIIGTKLTERAVTKIIEKAIEEKGAHIFSGPFGITIEVMSDIATLFDYLSYLTTPYIDLGAITDNEGKATLYLPNRAYTTTMDMSAFITQMQEPIDQTAPATQEQIAEQMASILLPTIQEELQPIAYKDITLAIPTKIGIDDKGVVTTETAEELKTYTKFRAINSKAVGSSRELTFWVEPRAIPPTTIGTGKEEEKMMKAHVLSQDRSLFPHVVSLSHYFQNNGVNCNYIDLIGYLADISSWEALNSPLESRWPSPEDDFTVVIYSKEDKLNEYLTRKGMINHFPHETVLQGDGWAVTRYKQTTADISGEHERFIFSIVVTDDEKREEAIKAFIENADQLGMPIEKEKEIPGFGEVFAIAGLLAVAYVLRRKK